jgi:ATP-binding cassette subfamily C protein CydCD
VRPTDPRVLRRLRPARTWLGVVVVAGTLSGVAVIAQAVALTGLVLAVVRGGPVAPSAVWVAVAFAARALLGMVGDLAASRAADRVGTDLRGRLVSAAFDGARQDAASGERSVLVTRGVTAAEPYLTRYVPALVTAAVLPPLTLVVLARVDLLSAGIVLATLPLVPVFGALVGLATRDRARTQWQVMSSLAGHFVDVVRGLPTLVAHRRAEAQSAAIRRVTDDYRRATLGTLRVVFASSAVLELVATLSVALVAVTVGTRLAAGGLDLRTGLLVLLLAPEAYWPLRRVGAEFHAAAEGVATFEEVSRVLDGREAVSGTAAPLAVARQPVAGAIRVEALTLAHAGRTVPVLSAFDLEVPAHGLTVVTGPSGCGKTTLLRALAGLHEPAAGRILVGGVPVDTADRRGLVAWVPQRPVVLSGTVRDNLLLARPGAGDDALWAALDAVALGARVRRLPGGLGAEVGQDGRLLSAGERARLVLARVLVSDRPWVLLDEPTAHLDAETERVVLDVVVALARTRGVVVVSHRDAVLDRADRVVALPARAPARRARAAGSTAQRTRRTDPGPSDLPPPADEPTSVEPPATRRGQLALAQALGALASASGVALTATAGWLIVTAAGQPPILTLLVAVVGVRLFGLARPVLRYAERLLSHDAVLRLLALRRAEVFDVLVPLTPGRLGRRRGELLTAVVDDVDTVMDAELRVRQPLVTSALVLLGCGAVAWWLLPAAAVVLLALATALALLVLAVRLASERVAQGVTRARAVLSGQVVEAMQTRDELVMWGAGHLAVGRVTTLSRRLGRWTSRGVVVVGSARAALLLACAAAVVTTASAAATTVGSGALTPAVAAALVLLPVALAEVVAPAADAGALAATTRAAQRRLETLAATGPAVSESPTARHVGTLSGSVALRGVTAGWAEAVLHGLDLDLAPGERLGVVGPSGCGKSTLAALFLRFLDPVRGDVSLDGQPLTGLTLHDVRRHVGLVDDDPHVFASSLLENVRLARPGAGEAEVETAVRDAHLGAWLDELPDGLGTRLGDGGAGVSGGERARLGLARALLADPAVLVLDEPTAHLDATTAEEVAEDLLSSDVGPRTLVWITHDRHGLDRVDRVLDLSMPREDTARTSDPGPEVEVPVPC